MKCTGIRRPSTAGSRARTLWQRLRVPVVDLVLVAAAGVDVKVNLWDDSPLGVGPAAGGCAASAFRRRFPLVVFLHTLPASLTQPVAVAPIVALFTPAERTRNRLLLATCVALYRHRKRHPVAGGGSLTAMGQTLTPVVFVHGLATAAAPVLFGQLLQAHRDLAVRLVEIEEGREHERPLHTQALLARERAPLAREMHDVVSHQVGLVAVARTPRTPPAPSAPWGRLPRTAGAPPGAD